RAATDWPDLWLEIRFGHIVDDHIVVDTGVVDGQAGNRFIASGSAIVSASIPLPCVARVPIRELDVLPRALVLDRLPFLHRMETIQSFEHNVAIVARGLVIGPSKARGNGDNGDHES